MPKVDMKLIFKTDRGQDVTVTIPNVEADCEIETIYPWTAVSTWYGVLLRNHVEVERGGE